MEFIGREKEKAILKSAYESDESEFVAVYGRRRVGKTYLVRSYFENKFTFYHSGLYGESKRTQLDGFRQTFRELGDEDCPKFESWLDAFSHLKKYLAATPDEKKIVFIDEIAWMDTAKSGFMAGLENFWNTWASARNDVLFIICASATSWILNKVFKNRGGLHNRVTYRVKLEQFTLKECEEYASMKGLGLDQAQITELYMALGGVPFYWKFLRKDYSIQQNLKALFLDKDAPLRNEFKSLYNSLFSSPELYLKVVKFLGQKSIGYTRSEISEACGTSNNGYLGEVLDNLEECGIIRSYRGYGKTKKDSLYQLLDCFSLFHMKFIERNVGIDGNEYTVWKGLSFERVVLIHVDQIKKKLGISGIEVRCNSWYSHKTTQGKAQIDLLLDRADGVINVVEVKWASGRYVMTQEDQENLEKKCDVFRLENNTHKALHKTLVSPLGSSGNSYAKNLNSEITLSDLFA